MKRFIFTGNGRFFKFHFGKLQPLMCERRIFGKKRHKAGCIFLAWDAATAGVITDDVRCFFVTQQMLGGVCWLWVVIETREWEQSGWLRFCVFPRQMSAALERKEVRTVSNRRVEAIHLVIPFPCLSSRWTEEDILGQGGTGPPERGGRLC